MEYIEDQVVENMDFTTNPINKAEYEYCKFINCSFVNADLSEFIFSECEFENCDLSNANFQGTALRDVKFKACKMLGGNFQDCNNLLLSFNFDGCMLNLSSFLQIKIEEGLASKIVN